MAVVQDFCDVPANAYDIYDELCRGSAYTLARGTACLNGTVGSGGSVPNECGNETSGYIQAYCMDGTNANNHKDCRNTYDTTHQGNSVTVSVLGNLGANALNTDGTALIGTTPFLPANTAESSHPKANFITGDASDITTLNLLGDGTASDNHAVSLNDVATATDHDKYGFALGRVTFGGSDIKLYVGILADTNLGAPLNAPAQAGIWNADIRVLTKDGSELKDDDPSGVRINLTVNYTDGTIETNDTAPMFSTSTLGKIGIAGRFTGNGLMYGNVTFGDAGANNGSLTGLIGQTGAVGIFKSNDANTTTPYVGGFVAKPGNTAPPVEEEVDCTDALGATLFDESCTDNDDEQTRACINGTDAATLDFDANCVMNDRVTNLVCTTSGKRANPFNAALCTDMNTGDTLAVKKSLSLTSAPIMHQEI